MTVQIDQIAAGVVAGADDEVDFVAFGLAGSGELLAKAGGVGARSDPAGGKRDFAGRLLRRGSAKSVSHGRARIAVDFGLVTEDATLGARDLRLIRWARSVR